MAMSKQTPSEFFVWLDELLKNHNLSDNKLAQKAGISQSVLSKARSELQGIGWDAGLAIALALEVQPEIVLRKLGLLPPSGPNPRSVLIDEMLSVFPDLSEIDQEELLQLARMKLERRKREARGKKQNP